MIERIYRGQSVDGVWHEGFLARSPGVKQNRPGEGWYISAADEKPYAHLVKPMSVGMSTGLQDENGQTVFEGDIIEIDAPVPEKKILTVKFGIYFENSRKRLGFYAKWADNYVWPNDLVTAIQFGKVIGNLIDTPEKEQKYEVD